VEQPIENILATAALAPNPVSIYKPDLMRDRQS